MIKKLIRRVFGNAAAQTPSATSPALQNSNRQTIPVSKHGIDLDLVSPAARSVCEGLQDAGYEAYIVGGAVRDMLLGREPKDFDIATNATPEQVVREFRRARLIGKRFKIVHVMSGRETIEVTTFRADKDANAQTDVHGRVLSDNNFGDIASDAARRDFTVNAMYYDPSDEVVIDFHGGLKDLKARKLRMIGDPETRYREDPVRMLRVVRFVAKLGFTIDKATLAPIQSLKQLISNCPAARLFDEVQKLLMSGHGVATLRVLREHKLDGALLPHLDRAMNDKQGEIFLMQAMQNTDDRIAAGKSTTPSFLFAALLWFEVLALAKKYQAKGESRYPALATAMNEVIEVQCEALAIPRRFSSDMREIWFMQPRFEVIQKRALALPRNPKFRAGYDFLLLRCESGEQPQKLADFWTDIQEIDPAEHQELLQLYLDADRSAFDTVGAKQETSSEAKPAAKKRRRVRKKTTALAAAPEQT